MEENKTPLRVAITFLAILLVSIDTTAVNLIISPISESLHFPLHKGQWISNAYLIIYAVLMIASGKLGDTLGSWRCLKIGVSFFLAGSIITGLSPSLAFILLGRFIQGIGGSFITPNAVSLLFKMYGPRKRGYVSGITSSALGVGLSIGPLLGGILADISSWRLLFFMNIPFCMLVLFSLPKTGMQKKSDTLKKVLDLKSQISLFFLGSFCFSLIYFFDHLIMAYNNPGKLIFIFLLIISFLFLFINQEKKSPQPLIHKKIITSSALRSACFLRFLYGIPIMGFVYFLAMYFQHTLSLSSLLSGLMFLPFSLAISVSSPYTGKIIDLIGEYTTLIIGVFVTSISVLSFIFITNKTPLFHIGTLMFLTGFGVSIIRPSLISTTMKFTPDSDIGLINSIAGILTNIGGSLGIALISSVLSIHQATNNLLPTALYKTLFFAISLSVIAFIIIAVIAIISTKKPSPTSLQK